MEPELGLGLVIEVEHRRVRIRFKAGDCERVYATDTAPIKRVRFRVGDSIRDRSGKSYTISELREEEDLLVYVCEGIELPESSLSDSISFTGPEDRLLHGRGDMNSVFNLRYETLKRRHDMLKSTVRGLVGGRIDLIPHQLYIAHETVTRQIPRALLADEVGLGKTIEACLIMHRLLISGRVNRALVMVPDALVNQWFVELLRRFNLMFRILDEEYCFDIEENEPDVNPFLEDALVLCSIDFPANDEERRQQAVEADWDLLIVDEAHHLKEGSATYELVAELSARTPGLLLLTATPEQLGLHGHFERLKLLDPARYYDYDVFLRESDNYHRVAGIANKLLNGQKLNKTDETKLVTLFQDKTKRFRANLDSIRSGDDTARQQMIHDLLDRHGIGRVMFRNTRSAMKNFPKRQVHPVEMKTANDPELLNRLTGEFAADNGKLQPGTQYDFKNDSRIEWLAMFLKKHSREKVLLICRTRRKSQEIYDALQEKIQIKAGVFHENLTLIQRDRNAAWFSEPDGARLLICSEIGSEGRNFQFAHHLVLFDLPVNPELLEQRIGRLDRIGQKSTINIHVPYIPGCAYEILFHWYHEGMNAFEKNVPGVQQVYDKFRSRLWELIKRNDKPGNLRDKGFTRLVTDTRDFCIKLTEQLEKGRDRLLELHSFRSDQAETLAQMIKSIDRDESLDLYMQKIYDFYGIVCDDIHDRTFQLYPGDLRVDAFPGFREKGMVITFDRQKAMAREDIHFISFDHPMVTGAIDLLLGSEQGNSTFAVLHDKGGKGLLLETVYVLECVAPLKLHIGRFLPATPVRVVVDDQYNDCTAQYPEQKMIKQLRGSIQAADLMENPDIKSELVPGMLKKSRQVGEKLAKQIIGSARDEMKNSLGAELDRLRSLKRVNDFVSNAEIELAQQEMRDIESHIISAQLRLDSLRLIVKG